MIDLTKIKDDERGIAMVVVLLVSMVILSLGVTIVQLAGSEALHAASDRKAVEAVQTADTGFAEYLAVLPTTADEDLCVDWDAAAREALLLPPEREVDSDSYPMNYELEITFVDDDGNVLDCATFNGTQVLVSATVTATAYVGRAGTNSIEANRVFEMKILLEEIPGIGVEQAIYGASHVQMDGNKQIDQDQTLNDAGVYSGCDLVAPNMAGGTSIHGSWISGCDIIADSSFSLGGNLWAKGNITIGATCIGRIQPKAYCTSDAAQFGDDGFGWIVSTQGNISLSGSWSAQSCVAVLGTVAAGPQGVCHAHSYVFGNMTPWKVASNPPPGNAPIYYPGSCPAEAAAYQMMGQSICDDPPEIGFPAFAYNYAKDWQTQGWTEVLGSSFAGGTNQQKCDTAETAIEAGYAGKTVVNLLNMDCTITFDNASIQNDFALIHDGAIDFPGAQWIGTAGSEKNIFIVHPKGEGGGETACATNSTGDGAFGADSALDTLAMRNNTDFLNITAFFYTPCHMSMENLSEFKGQAIGGTVTTSNNGTLHFNKMELPGQGEPIGYIPTVAWVQELPHSGV